MTGRRRGTHMISESWNEPAIEINGKPLSVAESMTLRVAVSSFLMPLQSEGLGDDETGETICAGYKNACRGILSKMT